MQPIVMVRFLVIFSVFLSASCDVTETQNELRLGTASLGGAYYPIGQGISSLVTQYAEGVSMVPVVTRGAIANPRLLATHDIEMGLTNADLAYFAYQGMDPYSEPLNVVVAGVLHPSVLHLVALAESSIESFDQLRGKRVALGPAGGPTVALAQLLLQAYGMSINDIVPSFLSYTDSFSQLGDRNVDAAFALSGYPAGAVLQTRATQRISFIEIHPEVLEEIIGANPYYYAVDIPEDTYGMQATMLAVNNVLIVRDDEPEELVYRLVEAIYGNLSEFAQNIAIAKQIDISQTSELQIPLHDGAARYFRQ